jgi:hypothetical protein
LASAGATGTAAITPAFESGVVGSGVGAGAAGSTTGSLVGAGAITPAFGSGAYGGIAGTSGLGTLGTAGTAAGGGMITPAFESFGGASSFMGKLKPLMDNAKTVNQYRNSLSSQSTPNTDRINANNQADNLTRSILNSGDAPSTSGRITNQSSINLRQKIAVMMQQGQQPLETNNVSDGYVVPVSPMAGVTKVAQQMAGAYMGKKAGITKNWLIYRGLT